METIYREAQQNLRAAGFNAWVFSSDDEAMPHYRRVRDEIRVFVEALPDSLEAQVRQASPYSYPRLPPPSAGGGD